MNTDYLNAKPLPFGHSDPAAGYYVRQDSPTSASVRVDRHEDTNPNVFIHDVESWVWQWDDDDSRGAPWGQWSLSGRSWREGKAQPFDDCEVTK